MLDLDAHIVAAINAGHRHFTSIKGVVRTVAQHAAHPPRAGKLGVDEAGRLIDRRLQALRRAGRIKYLPAFGWTVTDGVPVSEPLRHSTKDNGDCPHWCKACAAEERERNAGVASIPQASDDARNNAVGNDRANPSSTTER